MAIVFYGVVHSDEINEIRHFSDDIFFSTSLDGSMTFFSVRLQDVIATVNLEVSLRSVTYNQKYHTLIALASTNYFFFLSHNDKIYDLKNGAATLQFEVIKSFEITKANIDRIFSEGEYLYMTDNYGLIHRMNVEEICLKDSDMTPEQLKKKEMATRRRLRGKQNFYGVFLIL